MGDHARGLSVTVIHTILSHILRIYDPVQNVFSDVLIAAVFVVERGFNNSAVIYVNRCYEKLPSPVSSLSFDLAYSHSQNLLASRDLC